MGFYKNTQSAGSRTRGPVTIEFTGAENLTEIFEKLPERFSAKLMRETFRKAASEFTKILKLSIPAKLRKLSSAISVKAGKGALVSAGIHARKITVNLRDGRDYDAFFPLYWNNYGTNDKRDPQHRFRFARKPVSRHWQNGIRAINFVEKSWETSKARVSQVIDADLEARTRKFLEKHAAK